MTTFFDIIAGAVQDLTGISRAIMRQERWRGSRDVQAARALMHWLGYKLVPVGVEGVARAYGFGRSTVSADIRLLDRLRAADPAYREASNSVLETLLAIERAGACNVRPAADPVSTARRIASNPSREAMRVSTEEIEAMAAFILIAAGTELSAADHTEPHQEAFNG